MGKLASGRRVRPQARWPRSNYIYFPQRLREAIPGPELPGCARCLNLTSIDGESSSDKLFGRTVRLKLLAEESGKLTGAFEIGVHLQVEAARALARTLLDLVERVEAEPRP
ncbi:MAG TPA: hypothetical protein VGP62_18100 [Bryobacteraceae bacterium]|nr:hypothetical protein [Bryobacteraceae bacterium]